MKFCYAIVIFFFCVVFSFSVVARGEVVITSLSKPKGKVEKHFDKDKDGFLSPYERMLLRTHVIYRYPLVKKKKQRPYDVNRSLMLEPAEYKRYLQDEATGKLKTVYREHKIEQKALKTLEREAKIRAKKLNKKYLNKKRVLF